MEDIIALFTCYNPLIFFQDSKSLYEKLLYIYHNSKREYFIENGDHFSLQVCPERRARIGQTHHGRGQRSFGLGLSVYPLAPSYGFATAFTCFKWSATWPAAIPSVSTYNHIGFCVLNQSLPRDIGRNIRIFRNPGDSGRRLPETYPAIRRGGFYCQNIQHEYLNLWPSEICALT